MLDERGAAPKLRSGSSADSGPAEPTTPADRSAIMADGRIHLSDGTEETSRQTPAESFVLAYAAMVPIAAAAVAFLWLRGDAAMRVLHGVIVWSGAVLCFLSGVRRGLSFRQDGGPLLSQLASMLWLFVLGAASLVIPSARACLVLQILGYATMAIYDPIAARRHEAPRYFQQLRPAQMLVPIVSLALILAGLIIGGHPISGLR